MFNMAIDSKLRGCDVVALKVGAVARGQAQQIVRSVGYAAVAAGHDVICCSVAIKPHGKPIRSVP